MTNVFIVAELSANHNKDITIAKESIHAIAETGADSVKIQTYSADTITLDSNNEHFQIQQGTLWDGETLYSLYEKASTPWDWYEELKELAASLGLVFFSTPFDFTAVDYLEKHGNPIYKIASFEITDIPLIEYAASKGKPMIISTGIAYKQDILEAVEACRRAGNDDITLLKCTSSYPAPVDLANLRTMVDMKDAFGVKIGLSDHSEENDVSVAAVALGARVIEKHFILDKSIGGPDAAFSIEPDDFASLVKSIRNVEKALGCVDYDLSDQAKISRHFARSLFVVEDIRAGEVFNSSNIRSVRPGEGLSPKFYPEILGKKARCRIEKGTPLNWDHIEK